jgi:hypothetical protein
MQSVSGNRQMPACRLIVCEKTNHWAIALRGALANGETRIIETRSLPGCEEALAQSPQSVVAIEVTAHNLPSVVEFIPQIDQQFPQAIMVGLLQEDLAGAESLLREAGAIDTIASVLDAPRIARLAQRQARRSPRQEVELSDFVADLMPWGQSG